MCSRISYPAKQFSQIRKIKTLFVCLLTKVNLLHDLSGGGDRKRCMLVGVAGVGVLAWGVHLKSAMFIISVDRIAILGSGQLYNVNMHLEGVISGVYGRRDTIVR